MTEKVTQRVIVTGMVQGIGYRPYVAKLAQKLGVCGRVVNASGVVIIVATASRAHLDLLVEVLKHEPPAGAVVEQIQRQDMPYAAYTDFQIGSSIEAADVESESLLWDNPLVTPDLTVCDRCVRELSTPGNKRYAYPFISCTVCGPRYSILKALPYDRCSTTMSVFKMCGDCAAEYTGVTDVRRHAQTISCKNCGPRLAFVDSNGQEFQAEEALQQAAALLRSHGIVAVKDIGGFHLACSPYDAQAVASLRRLKGREKKPFAVMFETTQAAQDYCSLSEMEKELLESTARPVVLAAGKNRKQDRTWMPFVREVTMDSPYVGVMLYCNPLQLLLLRACGPLIMTSANPSGAPIFTDNEKLLAWLGASGLHEVGALIHDREILTPLDDSVVCAAAGRTQILRRARGIVPNPVQLSQGQGETEKPQKCVFAAGADMKGVFAYGSKNRVYLSQYFGDLQQEAIYAAYCREIQRMADIFGMTANDFVCDRHPGYFSHKLTAQMAAGRQKLVQHHHAHIASVMAEHGLTGKTLGVAFDGTGLGVDGTVWGSEFLLCEHTQFTRVGHLDTVLLPGGDENAKNADHILYGYLIHLLAGEAQADKTNREQWTKMLAAIPWIEMEKLGILAKTVKAGINTVRSTSMGRLFDAVSALLDICHYSEYEGQAAMELEYKAFGANKKYPLHIPVYQRKQVLVGDTAVLFEELIQAVHSGVQSAELAAGFICAVSRFTIEMCRQLAEENGTAQIALSGGCFQNRILLESVVDGLKDSGYAVYINEKVPAGDGGIALGQAYLAMR